MLSQVHASRLAALELLPATFCSWKNSGQSVPSVHLCLTQLRSGKRPMIVETLICLHLLNLAAYSIHLTSSHFKLDFLFLICFYILSSYFLCWIVPAFVLALF